jgi:hypothetical protein
MESVKAPFNTSAVGTFVIFCRGQAPIQASAGTEMFTVFTHSLSSLEANGESDVYGGELCCLP